MGRERHPNAEAQRERALARKNRAWGNRWKYARAKQMRGAPTSAEEVMWGWLRGNLTGVHFRRQAVVAGYVADFYCGLVLIAMEVDGKAHDPTKDRERDEHLEKVGVATIRVPARKVYRDPGAVFDDVRRRVIAILERDGWRRERFLEHYGSRRYWRKKNKNLAVWELYDKLAAL
jgi:very-short-patch-repair endonuclease